MDDGFNSYQQYWASMREMNVRKGLYRPVNPVEDMWAMEGPKDWSDLDTVRKGLPREGETTPPDETREQTKGSR